MLVQHHVKSINELTSKIDTMQGMVDSASDYDIKFDVVTVIKDRESFNAKLVTYIQSDDIWLEIKASDPSAGFYTNIKFEVKDFDKAVKAFNHLITKVLGGKYRTAVSKN